MVQILPTALPATSAPARTHVGHFIDPSGDNTSKKLSVGQILDMALAENSPRSKLVTKAAATYTAVKADDNQIWRATGNITVNLTTAATLGTGWSIWLMAEGGTITIDPNGTEQIDGSSTSLVLAVGQGCRVVCDGSAFQTVEGSTKGGKTLVGPGATTANQLAKFGSTNSTIVGSLATLDSVGNLIINDGTVNARVCVISGSQVYRGTFSNHQVNEQINNVVVGSWTSTGLNGAVIGASSAAALTCTTFTSTGIDDNATGERLQISDTTLDLGSATAASTYVVDRPINTGSLTIQGGANATGDGQIVLYGSAHATLAGDVQIGAANGSPIPFYFDASAATVQMMDDMLLGTSTTAVGAGNNGTGIFFQNTGATKGQIFCSATNATMSINTTADGTNISFRSGGTSQGGISIAGATVTYAAFTGSHLSQLRGGAAKIDILRGSICATIDEMCEWFAVEYEDHDGVTHRSEELVPTGAKIGDTVKVTYDRPVIIEIPETITEAVMEEFEEEFDDFRIKDGKATAFKNTRTRRRQIVDEFPLVDDKGKPVVKIEEIPERDEAGEIVLIAKGKNKGQPKIAERIEHPQTIKIVRTRQREIIHRSNSTEPVTIDGTVVLLQNDQLVRFEVCETPGSVRPYGVFFAWDHDGSNDALICGLGEFVVRIQPGEKVSGGDLIEAGDVPGCGRVMNPKKEPWKSLTAIEVDQRRVAKVTSVYPVPVYPGGSLYYPDKSFLVPASIHTS